MLIATVIAVTSAVLAQRAPESGRLATGTGLLAGQVVDPATRKPVPDALVTLWLDNAREFAARTMADGQGRFVFVNSPAGLYRIEAGKFGYVSGTYGQRRPNALSNPFDLKDGQIATDLVVPAWKTGAITGTVTDEAGQPVVGVDVSVFRRSVWMGEVRLVPHDAFSATALTDDRGIYRLSNLPPGEYTTAVVTTLTTFPAEVMSALQTTGPIRSQAFFTLRATPTPLGDALNQQIGEAVLITDNGTLIPPAPQAGEVAWVYRTTFAPGTARQSEASVVAVRDGAEPTLDIALRPSRAVRVSGRVVGADGPVTHTPVRLLPTGEGRLTDGYSPLEHAAATALTDSAGRFLFLGVPEGDYVIMMRTGERLDVVSATEPVTVTGSDVADMLLTARPAPQVRGRFEVPAGSQIRGLYIFADALDNGRFSVPIPPVGQELRFAASVAPGRYVLNLRVPDGLSCTAVMRAGRDIADEILVVQSEDIDLTVICGDPATRLAGTARKDDGTPDPEAAIVAFPVERAFWSGPAIRVRRLQQAYSDTAGGFRLATLPPGDYFVAAIPIERSELWRDPKFLDGLTRSATRVSLTQGDSRTIDLRTVAIR